MDDSLQNESDGVLDQRIGEQNSDSSLARPRARFDTDAEAELCRRYARRALLYGLRHLSGAAAAEDLAQEALVTMLLVLREGKLREPDQLASFVLGTCRTLVVAQRRKSQRREALLAQESVQEAVEQLPREVDPVRLQGCLERLGEREQAIVAMTFQQDLSAEAIAETLGLTAGNVRVLRHRTLARLHGCIGGLEHSP
jgi:RNA polymerase sigma-70 factor (ECF subfamily)